MSHILRGEEHLNNTVRQLMIYEAFDWVAPEFAHLSIMVEVTDKSFQKA